MTRRARHEGDFEAMQGMPNRVLALESSPR
jgi:hypothetical protein